MAQNRDIFLWNHFTHPTNKLKFIVKRLSEDMLTESEVSNFPELTLRILYKGPEGTLGK